MDNETKLVLDALVATYLGKEISWHHVGPGSDPKVFSGSHPRWQPISHSGMYTNILPRYHMEYELIFRRWQDEGRLFRTTWNGKHWTVEISAPGEAHSIYGGVGDTLGLAVADVIWQMLVESMFLKSLRYNSVTQAS